MCIKVCAAILVVLALAGCGDSETVVAVNQPPTITFTYTPIGVPAAIPVELTVSVSDADEDDQLTVTWEITRGALAQKNPERTVMEWAVPLGVGADTVTVSVSDGEDTATITEVIKVCTLARLVPGPRFRTSASPYLLRANGTPPRLVVDIPVTVEPGVEILVDLPETIIDVTGTLDVEGTAENPVVFTPNDRTLFCDGGNWWAGIMVGSDVGSSGTLNMDHAEIWYASNGVRLRDDGSAFVQNSTIKCCGSNGILHEGAGQLTVSDTEIRDTGSNGISIDALTLRPSSISISGCDISINGNAGISLDLNDPSQQVPITIEENVIEFNGVHGIWMRNWVWPSIHYNHISANGSISNVWLQTPFHDVSTPDTLDISCNYWGSTVSNQGTIESMIRDSQDTSGLSTRLIVSPWLNEDPYEASERPPCTGGTR